MSKGYADYRVTREMQNQPMWKPESSEGDYSRLFMLAAIFIAFGFGLKVYFRANDPIVMVRNSVEKTLTVPFQASVEGGSLLNGSETAIFRSHESSTPGKPVSITTLSGTTPAPFNSRSTLEQLLTATTAKELRREDIYGHPARHISGEFPNPSALSGQPKSYHFEYWLDLMNRKAVRLVVTGKIPNAVVSVLGDSLTSEVFLNIRWKY